MSTPIPPNKLKGPVLYAPRHVRESVLSEDWDEIEEPLAQAETEQPVAIRKIASRFGRQNHGDARVIRSLRSSLEHAIAPEPSAAARGELFQRCMRISLVIIFAAIVAYFFTVISTLRPSGLKGASDHVAGAAPQPNEMQAASEQASRLVISDQQVFANEPLPLAVRVEHALLNESLLLDGLAQGTTLSAGAPTSPSSWQLPYDRLRVAYLYAPKNFVGVMNTAADLLGPDKRVLDSRTVQLKWIAREPQPVGAPPLTTASAEASAGDRIGTTQPAMTAIEPIDAGEAVILMQKGRDFLGSGDISGARVAFRRLADAGVADAALALANTYDPDYLAAHNFLGVRGDRATARALYQRAQELGSTEASRILAQMLAK